MGEPSTPTASNDRLDRVRTAMEMQGVDLLALPPSDDLRWLLGASPKADERLCLLLVGANASIFVVPSVNAEQCRSFVTESSVLTWDDQDGPTRAVCDALEALVGDASATIAVGDDTRAPALLELQSVAPSVRCVSASATIGPLREFKDDTEITSIAASARTADAAMTAALNACAVGRTELEVAEEAAAAFRRAGAEEVMFVTVAAGAAGAFPHHRSGPRRMQAGEPVLIDLGGRVDGYASDLTRMAFLGEPDERYVATHAVVERAVAAGIAAARPGATCQDVDRATRAVIEDGGLGTFFVHRTGHGLGLSAHEAPWIVEGDTTEIRPGMVFSIEPGVYFPDAFGLRLEEIVRMTERGAVVMSELPRTVHVVR